MADFEKIAQVALPALAGVASAFDPYRNVSRGLNQAVTMRSALKGQAERTAFREQAAERAEADQKMQEQRQQWAEIEHGRRIDQYNRLDQDAAALAEFKLDLKGTAPEELWKQIDAATSMAQLRPILEKKNSLELGGRMVAALQSLDPQGQFITPEFLAIAKSNPSWAQSAMAGLISQRSAGGTRQQQALNQYNSVMDNIGQAMEQGLISPMDAATQATRALAQAPMGAEPPKWLNRDMIEQGMYEEQKKEAAPLATERQSLYTEYQKEAQPIIDQYNSEMQRVLTVNDPALKKMLYTQATEALGVLWRRYRLPEYNAKLAHYYDHLPELTVTPPATLENPQTDQKTAMQQGRETNAASRGRVPAQEGNDYLSPEFYQLAEGG
jgi:hypothetical protein